MTTLVNANAPVTIHFLTTVLGPMDRMQREVAAGLTGRDILAMWPERWGPGPLRVMVNGSPLEDFDAPILPGATCIVAPRLGGIELGTILLTALITSLVSTAVGFGVQAILGKPKPPRLRSDQESPTYDGRGIQTTYGQGARIPVLLGRHRVGGQVVASNAYELGAGRDVVAFLLSLGEGPLTSIAGLDLVTRPEINDMGGLYNTNWLTSLQPVGLRINGTNVNLAEASVSVRSGTIWQNPMPRQVRSWTLYNVEKGLAFNIPQTHETVGEVTSARVRIRFDALFQGNGVAKFVRFSYRFREAGTPTWGSELLVQETNARRSSFVWSFIVQFPSRKRWEIEVKRTTPDDDANSLSSSTWIQLAEGTGFDFSFPRRALLQLETIATQQIQGTQVNISTIADGPAVAWKTGGTWQPRAFTTGGGDVPGRSPAWLGYEVLTNKKWGLGRWMKPEHIDEQSFEDWGLYCAELVDDGRGGTHPRHQCDLNVDDGEGAHEKLLRIFRAGQAIPLWTGRKLKVKFEHPDSVALPRPILAVFSEADVADVEVVFRDTRNRPTILEAQIYNEERDYEPMPVELPDQVSSNFNGNVLMPLASRREQQDLTGVTRPAHARRLLSFQHGVNRLWYATLKFKADADAVLREVGDLVAFQHTVVKPFDTPSAGYRTARATAAGTDIYLDHQVTLASGKTYHVHVMGTDGKLSSMVVTAAAGTYPIDTAIAVNQTFTCHRGAVLAFGEQDKVVVTYECTSLTLDQNMQRTVECILYDEDAFTPPPPQVLAEDYTYSSEDLSASRELPSADDAQIVLDHMGAATVTWSVPPDYRDAVRVYWRRKPEAATPTDAPWLPEWIRIYEGPATSVPVPNGLAPGEVYELAVCVVDPATGQFAVPGAVTPIEATVEEFPPFSPPDCARFTAQQVAAGLQLSWAAVRDDVLAYYEVRRGWTWTGAELVGRTTRPTLLVTDPAIGTQKYLLAARHHNGLYSSALAELEVTTAAPFEYPATLATISDLSPSMGGAGVDVELDAEGRLVLSAGKLRGTYETPPLDAGAAGIYHWSLLWSGYGHDSTPVSEWPALGSGEGRWRRMSGRDPTLHQPGFDFDLTIDELFILGDPNMSFAGKKGAVGQHVRIKVEAAFDAGGGSWGAWAPFRSGVWPAAQRVKFRFTLQRGSTIWSVRLLPNLVAEVCAREEPAPAPSTCSLAESAVLLAEAIKQDGDLRELLVEALLKD